MKIKELLEYGKNNLIEKEQPYMLSKLILKHLLKVDNTYLVTNSEKEVSMEYEKKFVQGIEQLNSGRPIQYITNIQEFMGLSLYVDENVLIPQPDTEILVEEVLNKIENRENIKILDICSGSGAIGISIAKYKENVKVDMSDISEEALVISTKNAKNNNVEEKCNFIKSNMFQNIEDKYNVIVSNPPYIRTDVIDKLDIEVKNEPHIALDGGTDGLEFYRVIAKEAYKYLENDGILAVEIGFDQKESVIKILKEEKKYVNIYSKKDLGGNDRIIVCKKR